jgi:hypothetical protein
MRDTWDHVRNPDGSKVRTPRQERAVPPERIRMLKRDEVLVLHRNTRPVIGTVTPAWDRRGYERATLGQPFPWQHPAQPALEAPRREAIPMPAVPALDSPENTAPVPGYAPEEEIPQWQRATAG